MSHTECYQPKFEFRQNTKAIQTIQTTHISADTTTITKPKTTSKLIISYE